MKNIKKLQSIKYHYQLFWRHMSKFIMLFAVLTFLIYFILNMTMELITQADKYEKPSGRSVQVIVQENTAAYPYDRILDHWKFFIEFGE